MKRYSYVFFVFLLYFNCDFLIAQESTPKGVALKSSKNADMSSIENLVNDLVKPNMSDQEKAETVFDFLIKRTFHHDTPEEPIADLLENRKYNGEVSMLEDSIKVWNVYGFALCGSHSKYQTHIYNAMGMLGRVNGVNGHTVPEVKYGGKWRYFDVDMMGYVKDKEGNVVSVDDIKKEKNLLFDKHEKVAPYSFKFDGANGMWACLNTGVKFSMYGRKMGIHSMSYDLKKGETFTRYFQRQWGPEYRFYCPPESASVSAYGKRLRRSAGQGPSRDKTHYLFMEKGAARFGNFESTWVAPLADASILNEMFKQTNIKHNTKEPFIASSNDGAESEFVLNYYSPYVCAGFNGDLTTNDDDKYGFVFEGEFATDSGSISYSIDAGLTWNEAHTGGKTFNLDLTPKLGGRYGWLMKVSFNGKGAGLKSLKSYVSGQLSPASLPFVDGKTEMTVSKDNVACLLFSPDIGLGEEYFKKSAFEVDNFLNWSDNATQHVSFGSDNNGGVIYKVDVPNDLVFVKAGANFNCRRPSTRNGVAFSIDEGKSWIVACEQGLISNEDHNEEFWGQGVEGVLDLRKGIAYSPGCTPVEGSVRESKFEPKAVKSVLVKFYTKGGNGKLTKIAGIYAHYKKDQNHEVKVTHEWTGGKHEENIPKGKSSHTYSVDGGELSKNVSIKMEAK